MRMPFGWPGTARDIPSDAVSPLGGTCKERKRDPYKVVCRYARQSTIDSWEALRPATGSTVNRAASVHNYDTATGRSFTVSPKARFCRCQARQVLIAQCMERNMENKLV